MKERGQIAILGLLFLALIVAVVFFALAGGLPGYKHGADTIADAITSSGTVDVAYAWKGTQVLTPNQHAVESHQGDAYTTTDCYNRNGAFMVYANRDGDFNLLCRDDDGKVRDIALKRRGNSNVFDFVNAYTPKNGVFKAIDYWLRNTWRMAPSQMPSDAVIVIDNVIP